jgi:hypothetical protein
MDISSSVASMLRRTARYWLALAIIVPLLIWISFRLARFYGLRLADLVWLAPMMLLYVALLILMLYVGMERSRPSPTSGP